MTARIILDLTRLLSRAGKPAPTGVDRVELAYAQHFLTNAPDRTCFGALHRAGIWAVLPHRLAQRFIAATAEQWASPGRCALPARRLGRVLRACLLLGGSRWRPRRDDPTMRSIYLNVSHHHLNRPRLIASVLAREHAGFVALVHDLIPIEFPEYARPTEPARHRQRVDTLANLADGIITNSAATKRALQPYLTRAGRAPRVVVSHLGAQPLRPAPAAPPADPTFVCLGTIEPRKNHLLLLNLWRVLAAGPAPPRLVIVGRRGWENENVIDMLERCEALHGLVDERNSLSDGEVAKLLLGARALLLPSFAEGFGLPVAEALALGVPVICSDLPALREVGRDVPDYLDPLDGAAWLRAIREYVPPDSPRRTAQIARLATWSTPTWQAHMQAATSLLECVAAHSKS